MERRSARRRPSQHANLANQIATSHEILNNLESQLATMDAVHLSHSHHPKPSHKQSTTANLFSPLLPTPPAWAAPQNTNWEQITNMSDQTIKEMVLNKQIPTVIADAGATSNCGAPPLVS